MFKTNNIVSKVSLKFQTLISQIFQYFLSKNLNFGSAIAFLILSTKNFSVFDYKDVKHLTIDLLMNLLSLSLTMV